MALLHSTQEAHSMSVDAEVKFATPKNTSGYFALRVIIPRSLMARIDEPDRISIIGTPHEGFIIECATKKEAGTHAVNYKLSPHVVTLNVGLKKTKLSKAERKTIAVAARVQDGKIRISGMPPEWIKAKPPWNGGRLAPEANGANGAHHRVPANATTGALPAAAIPTGTAPLPKDEKVGADVTTDQLRARLAYTLRMAGTLKAELEKRTGLKLRVSRDLHVVVDLE